VGKKYTLPITVIRKRIIKVSLEEEIIQEEDALKVVYKGEHLELGRSLRTPSPTTSPIRSHPEKQKK
jgi:hypothetical protein